jgi:hypothetical protein
MKKLTQERLKEVLHYNPDTGIFTWKVMVGKRAKVGTIPGYHHCGYIYMGVDNHGYPAHHLAFLYMEGYLPEHDIDHINRIRDDNRWDNLRHVSRSCNLRNTSVRSTNKSGVTGVGWDKGKKKWGSCIGVNCKVKHLGGFDNLKEAVQARWEAEVKYDYPNCNSTSSAFQFLQKESNC